MSKSSIEFESISKEFSRLEDEYLAVKGFLVIYFMNLDSSRYGDFGKRFKKKHLDRFLEEDLTGLQKEFPNYIPRCEKFVVDAGGPAFEEAHKSYIKYKLSVRTLILRIGDFERTSKEITKTISDKLWDIGMVLYALDKDN